MVQPTHNVASGQHSPARFGRIIGGHSATLAPLNESEKDSDITKKVELATHPKSVHLFISPS